MQLRTALYAALASLVLAACVSSEDVTPREPDDDPPEANPTAGWTT